MEQLSVFSLPEKVPDLACSGQGDRRGSMVPPFHYTLLAPLEGFHSTVEPRNTALW